CSEEMEEGNHSEVTEFILTGLTDRPELQVPLFVLFLLIYVFTVVWNGGMMALITTDSQLHTPMYFFLWTLSFCDLCCSTVVAPKMLQDFLSEKKSISYIACAVQIFFSIFFSDFECFLLAVMAYDRYVAIRNPLLYTVIMSRQRCNLLVAGVCVVGFVDSVIHVCLTFQLSFCLSNVINHFFCDIPPLLVLSCSDTRIIDILQLASMFYDVAISVVIIFLSYVCIIYTILQTRSAGGRLKAFSTCASHLTAVGLFYGALLFMYFRPSSSYSMDTDKISSVFYSLVIPLLNPLIYSLRNKELRRAMNKLLTQF
uniref:Olfactory receptor n=1 Tax=Pelodiscus sinensis TaxID=13735 RepID=K7EZL5_PELSI